MEHIPQAHPTHARRRIMRRSVILLFALLCVATVSLNCGMGYPPRLWKCQCRQVCLDKGKQNIDKRVKQYACGYSKSQAIKYAVHHCGAKSPRLRGCKRVACRCTECKVSRQQICRRRPRVRGFASAIFRAWVTSIFDLNDTTFDEDSDDDDDIYEDDFVDPDDPEDPGPPPGYGPPPSDIPPPGYNDPPSSSSNSSSDSSWDDNSDFGDTQDDTWSDPGDSDWTDDDDDWGDDDDDWGDDDDDWGDDDDW